MVASSLDTLASGPGLPPAIGPNFDLLLGKIAQGDRHALRALYDALAPHLLATLLRIVKRREIAEDLLQDTFIHIWKKAHMFEVGRGTARAWLVSVTRRKAIDFIRATNRDFLSLDDHPGSLECANDHYDQGVDRETRIALARAIDVLRPQVRQAMKLCYFYGLTHEELAAELSVPLGTAKGWIKQGLAQVKLCMTPT